MANYKNQIRINIEEENFKKIIHPKETDSAFLQPLEWDKIMAVMNVLSGNEFKLYMYLLKWKGQGYYDFSPSELEVQLDMSENTSRTIRSRFVQLGFLKQLKDKTYSFIPFPDKIEDIAFAQKGLRYEKRKGKVVPKIGTFQ